MGKIFAIRIFHNTKDKVEFLFWAGLFRMCGIFVGEALVSDRVLRGTPDWQKQLEDDDCFPLSFYVGGEDSEVQRAALIDQLPRQIIFLEDIYCEADRVVVGGPARKWPEDETAQKHMQDTALRLVKGIERYIKEAMERIGRHENEAKMLLDDLSELMKIYLKYDLMQYDMDLQCYRFDNVVMDEVETHYYEAYQEIKRVLDGYSSQNLIYAKLFCAYKANEAAAFRGRANRIDREYLIDECRKLKEDNWDFINARVLLGLIYSGEQKYSHEAILMFEDALKELSGFCFASHIYYWVGLKWEQYEDRQDQAKNNYLLAYERKHKYRNMSKCAYFEQIAGNYGTAMDYLTQLIRRLALRVGKKFADPLEIEYYFSSCLTLGDIYSQKYQLYPLAAECYEQALKVFEQKENGYQPLSDFYDEFYGADAKVHRELTKTKTDIKTVFWRLRDTYQILQDAEKVQKYEEKLKYSI